MGTQPRLQAVSWRWLVVMLAAGACWGTAAVTSKSAYADEPFFLKGGERLVFFGDSITQNGRYVEYVDLYLRTRFPDKPFTVINRGISSETISGTTEPDHDPPRPDAHKRFTRDIPPCQPTYLMACFGMNDGNYHPFDEGRFLRYQQGVERLIDRAASECQAPVFFLTPPPFDPYRRGVADPNAVHYGYKFAAVEYDQVLTRYSEYLLSLRARGVHVADIHTALAEHVSKRRQGLVSFSLSPDAVHPNATGHWLMAQALLDAWHAPGALDQLVVKAQPPKVLQGPASELKRSGSELMFRWLARLPLPLDPECDPESMALENFQDRWNAGKLAILGLPAGTYHVLAGEANCGKFAADQLAAGINLYANPAFPPVVQSQAVLAKLQNWHRRSYGNWRKQIDGPQPLAADSPEIQAENSALSEMEAELKDACQPVAVVIRIVPVP